LAWGRILISQDSYNLYFSGRYGLLLLSHLFFRREITIFLWFLQKITMSFDLKITMSFDLKDRIVFLDLVWAMMRATIYELAASISYDAWRG
jgi:hypothetical protein